MTCMVWVLVLEKKMKTKSSCDQYGKTVAMPEHQMQVPMPQ